MWLFTSFFFGVISEAEEDEAEEVAAMSLGVLCPSFTLRLEGDEIICKAIRAVLEAAEEERRKEKKKKRKNKTKMSVRKQFHHNDQAKGTLFLEWSEDPPDAW